MDELKTAFLDRILRHDYSYQYSDDHRYWSSGQKSYETLTSQVKELVEVHKVDAKALLNECLALRSEQFTDGLTHTIINGLFKQYLK